MLSRCFGDGFSLFQRFFPVTRESFPATGPSNARALRAGDEFDTLPQVAGLDYIFLVRPMTPLDWTKVPPRSPREELRSLCMLPRMIDIARAMLPAATSAIIRSAAKELLAPWCSMRSERPWRSLYRLLAMPEQMTISPSAFGAQRPYRERC